MKNTLHLTTARPMALCLMLIALIFTYGCSKDNGAISAPIGNIQTLENLADSYNKVAESFPVGMQALPPQQKLEFVQQVFSRTGYSYTDTLLSMGAADLDTKNKIQKDLAELLLLPTTGLAPEGIADLYSEDEVHAIKKIKAALL